jgi:hypothetical protein
MKAPIGNGNNKYEFLKFICLTIGRIKIGSNLYKERTLNPLVVADVSPII